MLYKCVTQRNASIGFHYSSMNIETGIPILAKSNNAGSLLS